MIALFGHISGSDHIAAVVREADDISPIFAEVWHTDWSFQENPPAATFLYSLDIPPVGGDTLFANQHLALAEMPAQLRAKFDGKIAIHSAKFGYAPKTGTYATKGRYGKHGHTSLRYCLQAAVSSADSQSSGDWPAGYIWRALCLYCWL